MGPRPNFQAQELILERVISSRQNTDRKEGKLDQGSKGYTSRTTNQQVSLTERSESRVVMTLEEMLVTSSRRIEVAERRINCSEMKYQEDREV